jgi:methylglutaconyl-CoA hydratase
MARRWVGARGWSPCAMWSVATPDARFAFSEVKLGLIPAVIAPYVVRKIGYGNARALFLTGERFDAETALRIGLVHRARAC